jgi:hypothetical protein
MLTIRADVLNPDILAFIDGARSGAKEKPLAPIRRERPSLGRKRPKMG